VRRVEDITEALWGTRVSPSTVSNLNKKIYAKIEAWRLSPKAWASFSWLIPSIIRRQSRYGRPGCAAQSKWHQVVEGASLQIRIDGGAAA
jgi:hypothetical protein